MPKSTPIERKPIATRLEFGVPAVAKLEPPPARSARSRGIPRPGDTPAAADETNSSDIASAREATERDAQRVVTEFLLGEQGAIAVRDVGSRNLGWDLEADMPDGSILRVEVKGFATWSDSFVITQNELNAARTTNGYVVCVVTGTAAGKGELRWLDDPVELLTDDRLDPYQWIVRGWSQGGGISLPWGPA